jgi:hypothetical protein
MSTPLRESVPREPPLSRFWPTRHAKRLQWEFGVHHSCTWLVMYHFREVSQEGLPKDVGPDRHHPECTDKICFGGVAPRVGFRLASGLDSKSCRKGRASIPYRCKHSLTIGRSVGLRPHASCTEMPCNNASAFPIGPDTMLRSRRVKPCPAPGSGMEFAKSSSEMARVEGQPGISLVLPATSRRGPMSHAGYDEPAVSRSPPNTAYWVPRQLTT